MSRFCLTEIILVHFLEPCVLMDFNPLHDQITGFHGPGEIVIDPGFVEMHLKELPDREGKYLLLPNTKTGLAWESVALNEGIVIVMRR